MTFPILAMLTVYTYMYEVTIGEKRGHEFKRERGGPYGRTWREERGGKNYVTILSQRKGFEIGHHQVDVTTSLVISE